MEIGRCGLKLGGLLAPGLIARDRSSELATWIVSALEGSLMVSRLEQRDSPHDLASRYLMEYLETNVRAKESKTRAAMS